MTSIAEDPLYSYVLSMLVLGVQSLRSAYNIQIFTIPLSIEDNVRPCLKNRRSWDIRETTLYTKYGLSYL